jgi:iron complex outermembrane receptor protein
MPADVASWRRWGVLAAVACIAAIWAGAAMGDPTAPTAPAASPPEVVVTGTRIPQPSLARVSPVIQIDGREIEASGLLRVEDAINQLPQAFADQNSTVTNSATGTATVNLRDLGPERTLVLIDGKRLLPGDPTSGSVAPDLNFIPDALVDHIDVVTGGASAVYGSDAVAGVVNFIMKRDFTGVVVDAEAGGFEHDNREAGIQSVLAQDGQPAPDGTVSGGYAGEITVAAGVEAPDGLGNLTVYGAYRQAAAVTEATRDFSACALAASGSGLACTGSQSSPATGRFLVLDPNSFNLVGDLTLDPTGPGNTLRPFDVDRDSYNYAPFDYFQRPDQRWSAGAFAHYQISPSIELYADGMFMYDDTVAQLAPSGLFANTPFSIACTNPMLSAAEVQAFCTNANVPAGGSALVVIGHRDVNAGGRQDLLTHEDYRIVGGVRGDVADWRYDVSAQFASVAVTQLDLQDVSLTRAADALDVVSSGGKLVCASGNPACAPYDVFQLGAVTPAALDYIDTPGRATGGTSEAVVSANLSGKLGRPGLKSPWADEAVGVAVGAEWRRESLDYAPDAELATGDLASAGFAAPPVNGSFSVAEIYGEVRAPLVQRRGPLLQGLSVEGGYRYSWYANAGPAQTYKAGLDWAVDGGLRLRSSFNHAVRAPNVVELFTPNSISNVGLDFDPCAGTNPVVDEMNPFATEANCTRTGVTAAEYGHIAPSPAGYNALEGGNPDLRPEAADTWTVGLVFTPTALPAFALTIDYYDIRVSGVIATIDPDVTIQQCLQTGDPFLCSQIHREPGTGSLWLGSDGYIGNVFQNTASLSTHGIDVDARFRQPLSAGGRDLGAATFHLVGTYLLGLSTVTEPGAAPYDCAGFYGLNCGDPAPRWRHVFRVGWETPWNLDVILSWRYVSSVIIAAASPNPVLALPFEPADYRLAARSYIDLSLTWRVSNHLELRAGVNNLFDVDPPIVGTDFQSGVAANGNTYAGIYDALGRWMFIGITARM